MQNSDRQKDRHIAERVFLPNLCKWDNAFRSNSFTLSPTLYLDLHRAFIGLCQAAPTASFAPVRKSNVSLGAHLAVAVLVSPSYQISRDGLSVCGDGDGWTIDINLLWAKIPAVAIFAVTFAIVGTLVFVKSHPNMSAEYIADGSCVP